MIDPTVQMGVLHGSNTFFNLYVMQTCMMVLAENVECLEKNVRLGFRGYNEPGEEQHVPSIELKI